MKSSAHTNRLAAETSPYLLQHANNPVDWYPWGAEALERAVREDKPILLSVGYSACHWCHVMAHESFEDEKTAALMNAHFINIKLDREERPDLDQLYQGVVQLMGRGGGWPLTVFLTPTLKPFFGGTYFPSLPRHGLPAFSTLLVNIHEAWLKERPELEQQGDSFKDGLLHYTTHGLADSEDEQFTAADVVSAATYMERRVDTKHGGFGLGGPKFPNPMNVAMLLRGYRRTGQQSMLDAALVTLEKMALGGIFDQLGGGFHRYSVDERWLVPHFEKMLYDNAQLIHLYSEAMQLSPRPLWKTVVEETVQWLEREMISPEGGFYAAQDADSEGEEGKFFVWRPSEINAVLEPAEAALVLRHYGIRDSGNFEHGTTVLEVVESAEAIARSSGQTLEQVEARLRRARQTLLAARTKRVPPGRDGKVLAGWNGLMIRGLAFAGRVFEQPAWTQLAERAARFLIDQLMLSDGSLMRSFQQGKARHDGVLEDAGDVAAGLVALYQTTFKVEYLERAERIVDAAVRDFWDPERLAYFSAKKSTENLLVPPYALHDNAFPSGASTLVEAQVALSALTGAPRHLDQANSYLERMRSAMLDSPLAFGHAWLVADAIVDGAAEVTVVGKPEETHALLQSLAQRYLPTIAMQCIDPSQPIPKALETISTSRAAPGQRVAAFVCHHGRCQLPVHDATALEKLVVEVQAR